MIETVIGCTFLILWMFSIWKRIIKKEVRNYFFGIVIFLLIYAMIHYFKSRIPSVSLRQQDRYLCYLYDVCLTMIPLLAFFISLYIGKSEDYHLSKKVRLLYIPAIIISSMLITNELHHFVFTEIRSSVDYDIGFGFIIFLAWVLGMTMLLLISLYVKNRLPRRKKRVLWPIFIFIFIVGYGTAVAMKLDIFIKYEKIISITPVFLVIGILESCIQTGLIMSNTHYKDLFEATSLDMKIVDEDLKIILSSISGKEYSLNEMKQAEKVPLMLANGMRLSSADIFGGHVFWQEDISELKKRKDELEYDNEYLQGKNETLQRAYSTAREKSRLEERNRLYTEVQRQTSEKLTLLSNYIENLDKETNIQAEKKDLIHICILATYLKRRSNLFLLLESKKKLTIEDFKDGIRELVQNLKVFDITCHYSIEEVDDISFEEMIALYDALAEILECTVEDVSFYYLTVEKINDTFVMSLRFSGIEVFLNLESTNFEIEQEDKNAWHIIVRVKENEKNRDSR